MNCRDLIVSALIDPERVVGLSPLQWDLLVRQGRRANLLARLACRLNETGMIDRVPERPRLHLTSALRMVERQDQAMRWEVASILRTLENTGAGVILLKGAAYVMANLPAAEGRTFSDIDILVPKRLIEQVESQLMLHGWQGTHHDEYDQHYYRRWMHEIPPLRHVRRGTNLDVHHTIVPESARTKVNTPALFENAVPVSGYPRLFVLSPVDMVLHSATHLFQEGSLENGLRDLFDLDSLLRHFGNMAGFWTAIVPRARALGLTRPLYYALRFCTSLLGTPVPADVMTEARVGRPNPLVSKAMDFCYRRALQPAHESCNTTGTGVARLALYVRSHWLRMPFPLLACHLARKALRRSKPPSWDGPFTREACDEQR